MPTEVKIEIRGLSLCFLRGIASLGEVWNVAFLCDNLHTLVFEHNERVVEDWPQPVGDRILRIRRPEQDDTPCELGNFSKLTNLSDGEYGHGEDPQTPGFSHLKLERPAAPTTALVWMRVPNAEMNVTGAEDTFIMQTRPKAQRPSRLPDRGKVAALSFRASENFTLELIDAATGTPAFEKQIDINNTLRGKVRLNFNNDCGNLCPYNDSEDLYEFVVDRRGHTYVTWSEDSYNRPIETALYELIPNENRPLIDALWPEAMATPYGNCDPMGSNPPPGD